MEHQKLTTGEHFFSHPKKEDIEAEWTKLLLDWVKICGQVSTSLDQVDFMALLRMYGDTSVQCEPLPEALDRFLEQKFPKLQLSSKEDVTRKPYITATVLLYHCVTRGSGKMVIDICLYLPLEQQTMVRRLCEELRDMEITVANVDAAIAGAFETSSEILLKHEKQKAAADSRSMVSKQTVNEASLLPETSFNAINMSVLDMSRTKVKKTEKPSDIQGVAVKPVSSSATYVVIDTFQSNSFVGQCRDETVIKTTNYIEGSINTLTDKTSENFNSQGPPESLNTPDSTPTKLKAITTSKKVVSIEEERSKVKGKCNKIKNTIESSEKLDPKPENLPVYRSEIINTLHCESIITLLPSSLDNLDNNASKGRTLTSKNSENVLSTGENRKQNSMAFTLKSFDQSRPTSVSEDLGGIDMLYWKYPFIEQSSIFVYPEQPSSKNIVIDTTVLFQPKDISKYKIVNITHETSHSISGLEKPVTNNVAMNIDSPFLEPEFTSKSYVIDCPGNTKTPLFQTPVFCLRNSTDDIYKAGNEEVGKEPKKEDIKIKDTTKSLKKWQEPKTVEIDKIQDQCSDGLTRIFNGGPHRNTFVTRHQKNENIKADVVKDDMEYHCDIYTDNLENKSNHKENKHVFFSHKIEEPIVKTVPNRRENRNNKNYWKILSSICVSLLLFSILIICLIVLFGTGAILREDTLNVSPSIISRRHILLDKEEKLRIVQHMKMNPSYNWPSWECSNGLCHKANQSEIGCYESLSRCTLLCSGPQLWPHPTGHKYFGNQIVALTKNKRYKYKGSSKPVSKYLDEAFYLFQRNLARLEVTEFMETAPLDLVLKDLYIEFDVESDLDPKLRIDTNESYVLTVQTKDEVKVTIKSPSFHGVRHGLETLSQLILLDQNSGYLITLTNISIEDAPSFKYRGLMIATVRNHVPLKDLLRTIDAMAMCKLNTFHWRLSEATFPELISKFPKLFQDSGFNKEIIYTTNDIELLVKEAGFRGIRVLIEVASPEPEVRSTSLTSDATGENSRPNMSDALCLKMKGSESIFNILGSFYSYIINLSKVEDIIHLSNSLLVFIECFDLMEDRERFLERAQAHLTSANNGTIPKLPVIWYNSNLMSKLGWMWYDFGVQLYEEKLPDTALDKYKLIQSGRFDLSCKMVGKEKRMKCRSWQQMYNSNKWRSFETLTLEGGEGLLWMDMVETNNLDSLLWPRMAAVAERFWSDASANQSASAYEYLRLDAQRWRMMIRGVEVQAVWPSWCNYNPSQCFAKINA